MEYQQFAPAPLLGSFVECVWILEGHASELEAHDQPVLPDGRPELIVHFGDPFDRRWPDGRIERQAAVLFAGQLDAQLMLQPTGRISVLGIRFHPFGAVALLRDPQERLVGRTIGLEEVEPRIQHGLSSIRALTDSAASALPYVEALLVRMLDPSRIDPRVRFATGAILATRGQLSIDGLVRDTSITRRHLERRFLQAVGVSPKRLARIVRFQHALELLQQPASRSVGASTAAACGYADQSHFIRDFKTLAGCSPSEHLMRQAAITDFFVGGQEGAAGATGASRARCMAVEAPRRTPHEPCRALRER
jgi:AraC-like DNA-binding protein